MNNLDDNIKFTMEVETEGKLPFLDVWVYRKPDGCLGYKGYRKLTHTDLYFSVSSCHHPAQKGAVYSTLIHQAKIISNSDADSLREKLFHMKCVVQGNGYTQ